MQMRMSKSHWQKSEADHIHSLQKLQQHTKKLTNLHWHMSEWIQHKHALIGRLLITLT